jgi:uncharacterized protein (PEP-CTERM system associated)
LSAVLVAGPASAEKWTIVPTLSANTTYTDNVALAQTGSRGSDWVTIVMPGVSVSSGTGARLRVNAVYGAQFLERAQSGGSDVKHQFSGSGNAELVKQLLFLDARGSVQQQNISLLGPQADSNVNNTGNRATVRSFSVSPYLRHAFGQSAQAEARFTHNAVSSADSASFGKSQSNAINLGLVSGPAFKLYNWNAGYSRNTIGYSANQQPDVTTEKFTAGGRRLITSQVGLTSSLGYEKSDYAAITGQAPKGSFWNVGADWTPTPRTRLAATLGHRYFGTSRSFDFSHRTRLTTWGATYSESVTTTHAQALAPSSVATAGYLDTLFLSSVPDPVARQLAVQNFITQNGLPASLTVPLNFLTTQTILAKRWNASFGIQGVRHTVLTSAFTQTSESLAAGVPVSGAGDFASSNSVKQSGASVLWNWRFATLSAANASASYTRSEFPAAGRKDDSQRVSLGVTRQFQPKLSGSLNYRGLRNASNEAGAGYSENAITAALNLRF